MNALFWMHRWFLLTRYKYYYHNRRCSTLFTGSHRLEVCTGTKWLVPDMGHFISKGFSGVDFRPLATLDLPHQPWHNMSLLTFLICAQEDCNDETFQGPFFSSGICNSTTFRLIRSIVCLQLCDNSLWMTLILSLRPHTHGHIVYLQYRDIITQNLPGNPVSGTQVSR